MTGHSVHADFFAARPSAMDNTVWGRGRYYGKVNAEEPANLVFQRVIEAGHATLWYGGSVCERLQADKNARAES